ncbi:PH domain-containing protein [Candidatus Saccharibacteria bacterium]|nr:PH domain-containing protein [Candidatus Saccharibacteria bacterium]
MQPNANQPPATPPPVASPPLPSSTMLQSGESVLTVIKRHPIGLVLIYLQAIAAVAAMIFILAILTPGFFGGLSGQTYSIVTIVSFLLLVLLVFVLILVTSIYWQNKLILTDRAVIQILQTGPFQQKVSRLSFADIEDVTSEQKGLIPTIFNYGILHIETSGELKNFAFRYTPDSNKYASAVINARHQFTAAEKSSN